MRFTLGKIVRYGTKVAIARAGTYEEVIGNVKLGPMTMERYASLVPISQYSDKYLYAVARAVSGHEKWGPNQNSDAFEWEELLKAYPTFIRGGVYKDHNNRDRRDAVGIVIDAWPIIEDQYINVLLAINKQKAPNEVRMIQNGRLDACSMGCIVDEAICSICSNIARDESEYCEHVRNGLKGHEVNGKKCFEYNKGVRFFEVSLISPYSEAADPDAKIKQVLASKAEVAFEDWIVEPEEEVSFGTPVETAVGQKGVIIGSQGDTVEVIVQGRKSPQLFDLSTLTINDSSKEVIQMAAKNEELVKTAQGETKEEYGMEHPIRGNPSTGRWGGDYGSPAEKFKQDFDRTEKDSDEVDTRGNQTSSMIERGDYLHRGTTSDKAEGPLPKKASLEDIEALAARQLESATEAMQNLMEARTKEAEKKSIFNRVKQALGLEKEAEDYGMDKPYKGNPTTGSDAGNYAEATAYQDAQADEAKKKSDETMKDIEKQKPYNYSNTPENLYEKLPKVAASVDVEKIVTILKEVF